MTLNCLQMQTPQSSYFTLCLEFQGTGTDKETENGNGQQEACIAVYGVWCVVGGVWCVVCGVCCAVCVV